MVTERPESKRHASRTAAGLDDRRGPVREKPLNQDSLRRPKPEFMRRTRVVDDRKQIVEIGADRRRVDFLHRRGRNYEAKTTARSIVSPGSISLENFCFAL